MDDSLRVRDWWLMCRLSAGSREERVDLARGGSPVARSARRAVDQVRDVLSSGGVAALALVVALLEAGPERTAAATVGAGPLEDLLHDHGDHLLADVERLGRQYPHFADALRSVSLERGHLSPEAEARLGRWVQLA